MHIHTHLPMRSTMVSCDKQHVFAWGTCSDIVLTHKVNSKTSSRYAGFVMCLYFGVYVFSVIHVYLLLRDHQALAHRMCHAMVGSHNFTFIHNKASIEQLNPTNWTRHRQAGVVDHTGTNKKNWMWEKGKTKLCKPGQEKFLCHAPPSNWSKMYTLELVHKWWNHGKILEETWDRLLYWWQAALIRETRKWPYLLS